MTRPLIDPPTSETQLLDRANWLSGKTISSVADALGISIPIDPRKTKGFTGRLLELALGATAESRPVPDFEKIGVELKTIPISLQGIPRESTYVCTVPLNGQWEVVWENSNVKRKLNRVLWIPVVSPLKGTVANRTITKPLLWSPSPEQEKTLQADWEEFMDRIVIGEIDSITSHMGTWLQIRPKAANARSRRLGVGENGQLVPMLPRAFYLRAQFTKTLFRWHLPIPS